MIPGRLEEFNQDKILQRTYPPYLLSYILLLARFGHGLGKSGGGAVAACICSAIDHANSRNANSRKSSFDVSITYSPRYSVKT